MITNHSIGNDPNWPTKSPIVSVKKHLAFQPGRDYLGVRARLTILRSALGETAFEITAEQGNSLSLDAALKLAAERLL